MGDTKRSWAAGLMALLPSVSSTSALAQTAGSVFKDCPDCAEMVAIAAGSFLMGSKPVAGSNFKPGPEEQPQHTVMLKSFALGKYEVTQEQWYAVMGNNPSAYKSRTLPVEQLSWDDIQVFIQKLNVKTGERYRLPTESEWEYAARAGSKTLCSSGDDVAQLYLYAWFDGIRSAGPHPVGEKLPNKFGLYDMHGNVREWVEDCYKKDYAETPVDGRAAAEKAGCLRVNRGGSWWAGSEWSRSAIRGVGSSVIGADFTGFRLAKTLP